MSGAAFPLIKVSKASASDSNLLTNLLDTSPCENHLAGAALRSFKFLCSPNHGSLYSLYISFQTEILIASTSNKVLYFGNRWTNTSASQWFLQLIYFKCETKWRNQSWSSLISPLMVFVPSNPLNCIWFMSTPLSCRTSQINLNNTFVGFWIFHMYRMCWSPSPYLEHKMHF